MNTFLFLLARMAGFIGWPVRQRLARVLMAALTWACTPKPLYRRRYRRPRHEHALARPDPTPAGAGRQGRRKPEWVRREVLRLAVFLASCRRTADAFNRLHGRREWVSHEFVNQLFRERATELLYRRRAMRRKPPRAVEKNAVWALDLTQVVDREGHQATVLGIIDHGTRRALCLKQVVSKHSLVLVAHVLLTIVAFGWPQAIRTDNEGMFTGQRWRRALRWLNIRHQRSRPGCPWENGRIERFFGTMKATVRSCLPEARGPVQNVLDEFALCYNHARPHRNLNGLTPMEAWSGMTKDEVFSHAGRGCWVQALDGRLVAYRLRH